MAIPIAIIAIGIPTVIGDIIIGAAPIGRPTGIMAIGGRITAITPITGRIGITRIGIRATGITRWYGGTVITPRCIRVITVGVSCGVGSASVLGDHSQLSEQMSRNSVSA
jgi:hypothetical protein